MHKPLLDAKAILRSNWIEANITEWRKERFIGPSLKANGSHFFLAYYANYGEEPRTWRAVEIQVSFHIMGYGILYLVWGYIIWNRNYLY